MSSPVSYEIADGIENSSKLVVAAMHGAALGGGFFGGEHGLR